jgi:Cu-processing system permease protein
MNEISVIARSQIHDALRSRWLLLHGLLYLVITEGLILAGGLTDKALLSLVNVVLLLVPLVAIVFGTIHLYNARDYILLLLTQPVRRHSLFFGLYAGLAGPLAGTFALGVAAPFAWHARITAENLPTLLAILGLGALLTLVFVAVALLVAIRTRDRVRGIGTALAIWLGAAIAYDGLVLLAVASFAAYPIEKPLLAIMMLNPIDLARVVLLMLMDAGALMGYTGAVFGRFFGSGPGMLLAVGALFVWAAVTLAAARRAFLRSDF